MLVAHEPDLDCRAHHEQRISGGEGPRDTISREKGGVERGSSLRSEEKMSGDDNLWPKNKCIESRAPELVQRWSVPLAFIMVASGL